MDKLADLIKKQQQLEERLNQLEEEKTGGKKALTTAPPIKKVDLSVYETQAREMLAQAREEASRIREEASRVKEEALKLKNESLVKEAEIDRKIGAIEERERFLNQQKTDLERKLAEVEDLKRDQLQKLEKIASLSKDEARRLILEATERRMAEEIARKIKESEEQIKLTAEEKAKEILLDAMRHGAVDWVAEYTVSTIRLPDEEMKGRIIGKEGRNIRSLEVATGVEVELDESLDIRLSSFDPIRREIARRSLEKLIKDGRIQPQRIEEIVAKTKQEVDRILAEEG
ncbi:MAG: Rnase Y domain-containing protein, partial [Microgenomates group bacterium]